MPHGCDDVDVAGAPTDVAREMFSDLLVSGVRILLQKVECRKDHPRSAVAALQSVTLPERLLQWVQLVGERSDALDGCHLMTCHLTGKEQAGADGHPVDQHRARAADPVLAPRVRSGEAESLAQEVQQQETVVHHLAHRRPVHGRGDLRHLAPPQPRRPGSSPVSAPASRWSTRDSASSSPPAADRQER